MQVAEQLLASMARDGFRLRAENGQVIISPSRHIADEYRAAIRVHKEELLQLLQGHPVAPTGDGGRIEKPSTGGLPSPIQTPASIQTLPFSRVRLVKKVPRHFRPDGLVGGAILRAYSERSQRGNVWVQCRSGYWAELPDEFWEPLFD